MYSSTITEYEDDKCRKSAQSENGTDSILNQPPKELEPGEQPLIWHNIFGITMLHIIAISLFVVYIYNGWATWTAVVWGSSYGWIAGFGITAGGHRLWAHRSYKAKLPLRILLAYLFCMAGMTHLFKWIRVHRTHHKYTDTCADPHNSNRGFFFSHVGWLMMKHHPAVTKYGKTVDMSDIAADPVIRFVDRYYSPIMLTLAFILPTVLPVYLWNEPWDVSIGTTLFRYMILLNCTFSVNSFAHMWGNRSYNRASKATENSIVSIFAAGEGWHNYHHSFPWDYKAAELPYYINLTTIFIEFFAWIGWAYDLKTPNREIIEKYRMNKGDGSIGLTRRSSVGKCLQDCDGL